MTNHFDEFSKSLAAESIPRRQSLRLLGAAMAGTLLGPLGMRTAWAGGPDPCKAFCNQCPKSQRTQCLAACHACNGDTNRICGSCATGFACTDLASDSSNCGACGNVCRPGPLEDAACFDGRCVYLCVEGAVRCGGRCTFLESDRYNCGACGNVCGGSTPDCYQGACVAGCQGYCPELWCGGDGCGGECGCPAGWICGETAWCYPE